MLQTVLDNYFRNHWTSRFEKYTYSGYELANTVQDQWVLDVGCGINPFKNRITNLIGIDPVFEQADIMTTIEDFSFNQKFNTAFCLDSIIFGSKEHVLYQIECLMRHLTPTATIHWRSNSTIDLKEYEKAGIELFNWSQTDYVDFAEKFNFRIFYFCSDSFESTYVIWIRI